MGRGSATGTSTSTWTCRWWWWAAGPGTLKGGRHVRYKDDTPIANLYVSLLDKLGLPMDQFGDSTGQLNYLTDI